jgi:pSer/pThr/pTyr-binding forkhead associated (FHA) protein
VTVGRSSANDVCVSWDAEVSREHAILEYRGDGWDLVDEGRSRNGTFVDGERVSGRYTLQDAQVIRVGNTVLLYRSTGAATRLPARGSVVTAAARVRSAAEVGPDERALLTALNRGEVGESAELAALRRRFDVQSLPPGERDVVLLQRARALRLLPDT